MGFEIEDFTLYHTIINIYHHYYTANHAFDFCTELVKQLFKYRR